MQPVSQRIGLQLHDGGSGESGEGDGCRRTAGDEEDGDGDRRPAGQHADQG